MTKDYLLQNIEDDSLDAILALPEDNKLAYFCELVDYFFPNIEKDSNEYINAVESYFGSFYLEKLFRSNRFFQENFSIVYTKQGLIRSVVNNLYLLQEDLVIH